MRVADEGLRQARNAKSEVLLLLRDADDKCNLQLFPASRSIRGEPMKDVNRILQQKEAELNRVRHEIESLRIVASLLVDSENPGRSENAVSAESPVFAEKANGTHADLEPTGTDGLFSSITTQRSSVWSVLRREK
jgi:hypothetical protein